VSAPGVRLRESIDELVEDQRRILAGFAAITLAITLDANLLAQLCSYALAWLVVGAIDDLGHQLTVLHGCVHDAADEAALKMLRAHQEAEREARPETPPTLR
jgi:predicted Co/Zn/Cd cation transporter (cation efflux family)